MGNSAIFGYSESNLLDTDIGTTVEAYNADILKADEGDELTAGYTSDHFARGIVSGGTVTPTPATNQENFQSLTNGGAFTLAPPTSNCSVVLDITNNASAGVITTTGFTLVDGDAFTTTNSDVFRCYITKGPAGSHLSIKAL